MAFPAAPVARWVQRRRDTSILEARRLEGVELLGTGLAQVEIARRLGVSRSAVCQWIQRASRGGIAALLSRPRPGRPKQIFGAPSGGLSSFLARGADSFGFPDERWSLARLALAATRASGIRYSRTGIRRRLLAEGYCWTPPESEPRRSPRRVNFSPPSLSRGGWVLAARLPVERGRRMFATEPEGHSVPQLRRRPHLYPRAR
jgi:transposase